MSPAACPTVTPINDFSAVGQVRGPGPRKRSIARISNPLPAPAHPDMTHSCSFPPKGHFFWLYYEVIFFPLQAWTPASQVDALAIKENFLSQASFRKFPSPQSFQRPQQPASTREEGKKQNQPHSNLPCTLRLAQLSKGLFELSPPLRMD